MGNDHSVETRRNRSFDLLRILFAVFVLLAHAFLLTDGTYSRELFFRLTGSTVSLGELGVDGFFVLSGYLIVMSWCRDPVLSNFMINRILRIVPGYLVAVIVSTAVVGVLAPGVPHFFRHVDHRFYESILQLRQPATPPVLPGFSSAGAVNGSLWTIAYEFRCYLLVATMGVFGIFRKPAYWLVASLLGLIAMAVIGDHTFTPHKIYEFMGQPNDNVGLVTPFLIGGTFYLFRERIRFRTTFAVAAIGSILLSGTILRFIFHPVLVLAGSYLMFNFAHSKFRVFRWMENFPDISYGIYLYGWPVEALWIWNRHGSPWTAFLFATFITFGLGHLSWRFVERPMLALKRRSTLVRRELCLAEATSPLR